MKQFAEELEALKTKVLEMGALVEEGIFHAVRAVVDRDASQANQVIENEHRVNRLQVEIDDLSVEMLALHAPVAIDLRFVAASIRINTDLERMGDLAVGIAESSLSLDRMTRVNLPVDIPGIAALVQPMVRKSLNAFVTRDAQLAEEVLRSDDAVDKQRSSIYDRLVEFMEKNPTCIRQTLDVWAVVRRLERIADHATNISEDVVFLTKGLDVRHHAEIEHRSGQE
jgi:phosphate transport system protein